MLLKKGQNKRPVSAVILKGTEDKGAVLIG